MLGDIIGRPYEFDRGPRDKNFELFDTRCKFSDDSLLSIAVADALLKLKKQDLSKLSPKKKEAYVTKAIEASMKDWCNRPEYDRIHGEYGIWFGSWVRGNEIKRDKPSMGNGSAMRVGAVGWLYDTLEETLEYAKYSALVSHKHPEGIKGAQAVAAVIFLARNGIGKDEIKNYISKTFGYNLNQTVADLQKTYCSTGHQDETCPGCVPQAIICFLEADSYEDAVRNAVSIGGDTDTIGCITGSMAEAMYGVPMHLKKKCQDYIDEYMRQVADEIVNYRTRNRESDKDMFKNAFQNPFDYIERYKTSGDIGYGSLYERLRDLEDMGENQKEKSYAAFASKAVKCGYPIDDLEALWEVRKGVDMPVPDKTAKTPEYIEAKKEFDSTWEKVITNKKHGRPSPLTEEDRINCLNTLQLALDKYQKAAGTCMSGAKLHIVDVSMMQLDKRIEANLSPAEKARLADTPRNAYSVLDSVDKIKGSSAFRNMKKSFKEFYEFCEKTDFTKDDEKAAFTEKRKELLKLTSAYLKYKDKQNKGLFHSRSKTEYLRVSVVSALYDRLKNNTLDYTAPAPADPEAEKIISTAKNNLKVGKDTPASAAILLSAKKMKQAGEAVTKNALLDASKRLLENKNFTEAIKMYCPADIHTKITNGALEKRIAENEHIEEYSKTRQQKFNSWMDIKMKKQAEYSRKLAPEGQKKQAQAPASNVKVLSVQKVSKPAPAKKVQKPGESAAKRFIPK